jgi:hypothetical protein
VLANILGLTNVITLHAADHQGRRHHRGDAHRDLKGEEGVNSSKSRQIRYRT